MVLQGTHTAPCCVYDCFSTSRHLLLAEKLLAFFSVRPSIEFHVSVLSL